MFHLLATRSSLRLALLLILLAAATLLLLARLGGSPRGLTSLPLLDFVEYWAAGRLNVHGENPYDPERIQELEREAGRTSEGILMWNPPWTLPLVMPLGLLDCRAAHLLWLALHFAVLAWCTDALWRLYGGSPSRRGLAWLLAFTFLPTLFALTVGQITPLVLLGAVLFLVYLKQKREVLAGAALVLLAIKPHLAYLFWIALLLWCLSERRWAVLGGGLLAGAVALGLALVCNPDVLEQYWYTLSHRPPAQYRSPTLGALLRLALGEEHFRLQFLALVPGLVWFVPYWLRHRKNWDWGERLPLLLLVSMLTAPYGAWPFDLVLLLVPVMQVAAHHLGEAKQSFATCVPKLCLGTRRTWLSSFPSSAWERKGAKLCFAFLYLAINGVAALQLAFEVEYLAFIWMTPALLFAYLALRTRITSPLV